MGRRMEVHGQFLAGRTMRRSVELCFSAFLKVVEPFIHGSIDLSIDGGTKTGGCLHCVISITDFVV